MHILIKPAMAAMVAGPFVGALTTRNVAQDDSRRDLIAFCRTAGVGPAWSEAPTLLTVMAAIEASATLGAQMGRRIMCDARHSQEDTIADHRVGARDEPVWATVSAP